MPFIGVAGHQLGRRNVARLPRRLIKRQRARRRYRIYAYLASKRVIDFRARVSGRSDY